MSARLFGVSSVLALMAAMPALAEMNFNRISTFATPDNMAEGEDRGRVTSAEIISASPDGMTLIYTDSPLGVVGLIDIADPKAPKALGNIAVGGEPTTAKIIGGMAFAGVNTSADHVNTSGKLVSIDLATKAVTAECELGGQPDSVATAKDGSFLAIAIENERDEDLNDGKLPQMPAGFVVKLPVKDGVVDCAGLQKIAGPHERAVDAHPDDVVTRGGLRAHHALPERQPGSFGRHEDNPLDGVGRAVQGAEPGQPLPAVRGHCCGPRTDHGQPVG